SVPSLTASSQLVPSAGDFTIDALVALNNGGPSIQTFLSQYETTLPGRMQLSLGGDLRFFIGSPGIEIFSPPSGVDRLQVAHYALCRHGDTYTLFSGGRSVAEDTRVGDVLGRPTRVGYDGATGNRDIDMYLLALRITYVARWTADFDVLGVPRYAL